MDMINIYSVYTDLDNPDVSHLYITKQEMDTIHHNIKHITCCETYDPKIRIDYFCVERLYYKFNTGNYFKKKLHFKNIPDTKDECLLAKCDDLIIRNILSYLPIRHLMFARLVNKRFYQIIPPACQILKYTSKKPT